MLVTQCPRCHESVCVPDTLLTDHGKYADVDAKAQCPWCLETLDGSELRAILPPALVLVGDHSLVSSGATVEEDWATDNEDFSSLRTNREVRSAVAENHFRDADISLEDHGASSRDYESEVSELDSVEIDHSHEDDTADEAEFEFQQPASVRAGVGSVVPDNPPQRVIKISVPGKSGAGVDKSAGMMDIDPSNTRRRSKKGSPLKTMIGVVLGGLLALPIVGTILHFATGQHIPYLSDVLPGGGTARTQIRANQPMLTDDPQTQVAVQPSQTPLQGRLIDDDIQDVPAFDQLPDPADTALQAITGGATNANAERDKESISPPNSSAALSGTTPPEATGTTGTDLGTAAPEVESLEATMPDTNFPSTDATDLELADDTADDDTPPKSDGPDSNMFDTTIPGDDLLGDDLTDDAGIDNVDPTTMLPDSTPTDDVAEFMEQDGAVDFNDVNLLGADPTNADPLSVAPVNPDSSKSAPDADMKADDDDLFAGISEIPVPSLVAPDAPSVEPPSLDVDAEVAQLTNSLGQINGLAANDPQRGERIQQFYEALTKLAGNVPADSVTKLSPLLDQIASNTGMVIAFAKAAPEWVGRRPADRGGDGVIVVGKMSGDTEDATFTLLNRQELSVKMPASMSDVPPGFQIGLGRITGSGPDASLDLELLQTIKQ